MVFLHIHCTQCTLCIHTCCLSSGCIQNQKQFISNSTGCTWLRHCPSGVLLAIMALSSCQGAILLLAYCPSTFNVFLQLQLLLSWCYVSRSPFPCHLFGIAGQGSPNAPIGKKKTTTKKQIPVSARAPGFLLVGFLSESEGTDACTQRRSAEILRLLSSKHDAKRHIKT